MAPRSPPLTLALLAGAASAERPLWEEPAFLNAVRNTPVAPAPPRERQGAGPQPLWGEVDRIIGNFSFLPHVSFSAGDASGRKHTFEKGRLTMSSRLILASSSKFPAALAIAGVVSDGILTFDTPIRHVFDWWTNDPSDMKYGVTLRHLLTFTSGLVSTADPGVAGTRCLIFGLVYTLEECAREIYTSGPWQSSPGKVWSYHSLHLQLAGAMASKASGLPIKELLEKYLLRKLGMTRSFWIGYPNPHLAAAMVSTGDDYDALLRGVLDYSVANKSIVDELEKDVFAFYPGLMPAPDAKDHGEDNFAFPLVVMQKKTVFVPLPRMYALLLWTSLWIAIAFA